MADFVPGLEASGWQGVGEPRSTSAEIIDKFNKTIDACLADPRVKARPIDLSGIVIVSSPAESASSSWMIQSRSKPAVHSIAYSLWSPTHLMTALGSRSRYGP